MSKIKTTIFSIKDGTAKRELYQSDASYVKTLRELKRRLDNNTPLHFYDCEDIGNKNTECTLGLCDDSIERMQDGVYSGKGHTCPHDSRYVNKDGSLNSDAESSRDGCFYSCHIFKKRSTKRQDVGNRIHAILERAEVKYGKA